MMPPRDEAFHMHSDFRELALKEGNEPILCSRMHFGQWADKVDAMFRHIVKLENQLDAMKELERRRWESASKTFGLERIVHQSYTCNGAVDRCERERFGMCQWHEDREAK